VQARLEARGEGIAVPSHITQTRDDHARLHKAQNDLYCCTSSALRHHPLSLQPVSLLSHVNVPSPVSRVSRSLLYRMASMQKNLKRAHKQNVRRKHSKRSRERKMSLSPMIPTHASPVEGMNRENLQTGDARTRMATRSLPCPGTTVELPDLPF
jgi:hypothetical protein